MEPNVYFIDTAILVLVGTTFFGEKLFNVIEYEGAPVI